MKRVSGPIRGTAVLAVGSWAGAHFSKSARRGAPAAAWNATNDLEWPQIPLDIARPVRIIRRFWLRARKPTPAGLPEQFLPLGLSRTQMEPPVPTIPLWWPTIVVAS